MSLADLGSRSQRYIGNMAVALAGLAIASAGAATVRTAAAINYVFDGIPKTIAALAAQALSPLLAADFVPPTSSFALNWLQPNGGNAFYVQPANTLVYYVLCVNKAGVVKTIQGLYDGQIPANAMGLTIKGASRVPAVPETWVPFGMIKVQTAAGTFNPGVTALDAAGMTVTFMDVAVIPPESQP